MTTEEKAKAYDYAVKRIAMLLDNNGIVIGRYWLQKIFPELRESEDERIRKELMNFVAEVKDIAKSGRDSWAVRKEDAEMCERFLTYLEKQKEPEKSVDEDKDFTIYHPLKCNEEYECMPYSFYGSLTSFSENKDLIEFLHTCFYTEEECEEWIEKQKEQKPEEWREEDERKYQCIRCILLTDVDKKVGSWKYSEILEWYEKEVLAAIRYTNSQPHWKPSEEQMQALWVVESRMRTNKAFTLSNKLSSLYNDLKKL